MTLTTSDTAPAAIPTGVARGGGGPAPTRIVVAYGFWIFILSDIVMFSALFAAYAVLSGNTAGGPAGGGQGGRGGGPGGGGQGGGPGGGRNNPSRMLDRMRGAIADYYQRIYRGTFGAAAYQSGGQAEFRSAPRSLLHR